MSFDQDVARGARAFRTGASGIDTALLSEVHAILEAELVSRIGEAFDEDTIVLDVGKRTVGGAARLRVSLGMIGKPLCKVTPRELIRIDGFGKESVLATEQAIRSHLKAKHLPTPPSWRLAPSWETQARWGTDPGGGPVDDVT